MIRTMLALTATMLLGLVLAGCNNEPTPEQAPPDVQPPPPVEVPSGPAGSPGN